MGEISLKGMVSLAFLKKERFTGSYGTMRYMLCMEEERLKAAVYPGPYCWEETPDDQKITEFFEGSALGLKSAVEWLNKMYDKSLKEKE